MAADTVAAPMLAKLFPRSSVARSLSGASSQPVSFWAGLLPWEARCRTLYLLLAKMAGSESEKNADKAKKASRGRTRIVNIQEWNLTLSDRYLAARFRHRFLDSILDVHFADVHHGRKF